MKKFIINMFIMILFSCTYNVPYEIAEQFNTETDVIAWVMRNIDYQPDIEKHNKQEYWQSPSETLESRTGDCEDYVILAMYLLKEYLNIDSQFCGTALYYENEFLGYHAILKVKSHYYTLTNIGTEETTKVIILCTLSYTTTIAIATSLGARSIDEGFIIE